VYRIRSPSIAVLVLFHDNPFQYNAAWIEGLTVLRPRESSIHIFRVGELHTLVGQSHGEAVVEELVNKNIHFLTASISISFLETKLCRERLNHCPAYPPSGFGGHYYSTLLPPASLPPKKAGSFRVARSSHPRKQVVSAWLDLATLESG
jgi:hypothetical protein